MAAKMLDADGKLKSFSAWAKEVKPISDHYNKVWLRTEYNTAVLRSQRAAEFKQFQSEADVYPNLKWTRTTALTPGEDHAPFWSLPVILPVNDKFWNEHHPGDRWNCKCGWRSTDEDIKRIAGEVTESDAAQMGLENNPAQDGQVFSDNQPYFPENCAACPLNGLPNLLAKRRKKDCYNCRYAKAITETARAISMGETHQEIRKNVNEWKVANIPEYTGILLKRDNMLSKSLLIYRNSVKSSFNHTTSLELKKYLPQIEDISKRFEYVGWRTTDSGKHPDTDYFTYYKVKIGSKIWFANIKASNASNKEVLYCFTKSIGKIRKKKPDMNVFKAK